MTDDHRDAQPVCFRLPSESGAVQAWVVGEFNNWSTDDLPMERQDDGSLQVTVRLRPGTYRYRFYLGDGRWENAWDADAYAANEFGGADSVVIVRAAANGAGRTKGTKGTKATG